MRLKLEDATLFAKAIDLISELVFEVKIKLTEYGLSIVAIDPANVSMVSLKVPKSSFKEYEVADESLGINLENLKKVLRRCEKTSSLILEKKDNQLEIIIEDKIVRTFNLGLIEIDSEDKEFPTHLEYSSSVEIDCSDLMNSLEDCAIIGDACSFIIKENKFIVEARELNSAKTEFSSDDVKISGENSRARYSLGYLQKFMRAGKSFKSVVLNFANDHPIRLDFKTDALSLSFLLAPRIETED